MKTTNKIMRVLSVLFVSILISSCSPEDGKDGQDGMQGPVGNANVTLFTFNEFNAPPTTGNRVIKNFALTQTDFNQSLLYTFVSNSSNYWYPLPGYFNTAFDSYRIYYYTLNENNTSIEIIKLTHDSAQIFKGMRIYAVKANSTVNVGNGKMMLGTTAPDGTFYTDEEIKSMTHDEFINTFNIIE